MSSLRLFLLSAILSALPIAEAQSLAITHVNVIQVSNGSILADRTVLLEGKHIISVAATEKTTPRSSKVIDAHGEYLIPGLWDMHTHVFFDRTAADGTDVILPLFLVNGVTGIRDMGSVLDQVLDARKAIAEHRLAGPRMIVSGPMLDGPTSQYQAAIAIQTPEDGRHAVDRLKNRGVDFIKVQSGIPREAYFAIASQATQDHIDFEGHVPDAIRAKEAISAGQRTFEHLIGIFEASSPDEDKYLTGTKSPGAFLATYDSALEANIIQLLAKNQVWQCPTLFWERGQWLVDEIDPTQDRDLAYAPRSWVTTLWPGSRKGIMKSLDVDPVQVREKFVQHELDLVQRLHAAGVPFLAGTDTPAGVDLIPGASLHLEMQRFVDAGFTPLEALQTATLNPARFFHKDVEFGDIAPGRLADLVLLRANPLTSIANTRTIDGVFADGRYYSHNDLEQMKLDLRKLAASR